MWALGYSATRVGCRGAIGVSLFRWWFYLGISRCSGVRRSVKTFNSLPFPSIPVVDAALREGMRGSRLRGNTTGRNLFRVDEANARGFPPARGTAAGVSTGPIWPDLALFTPNGEGENEAGVVSFGSPLTRTRCASMRPRWSRLASPGVGGSDETFNSVSFSLIQSHSFPNPHPSPLPESEGVSAFA